MDHGKQQHSHSIQDMQPMETLSWAYTIRTHRHRYTEWVKFLGRPDYEPIWSVPYGIELYDHEIDPDENVNRANFSTHAEIRSALSAQLRNGWRQVPIV